ncbi:glutaminase [Clostridium tetanomorphum]|uniref:Glutaminase n=1 Tax=Clostridium tetanomorphum TaxID=1553 RepID=A0A923EBL5_CLOTT|nr:glutaminase A [Clostridium tetanomorphum]KAJ50303.1 glutaminase [Clostridium tetanomorphum DSM 665]MBC2397964.1 glutaminase A [Clostridium tetanomorphum]MBP1864530.1 glutaminase [Clostridium tetanomorphum]NRS82938.1 glutaminase [Clostridium tetanomorphum]NRZ98965.1 glutaminase [Clostridium tetanomorphum]
MEELLENIVEDCREYTKYGSVASYIPELKNGNKNALGICVTTLQGKELCAGDYKTKFTMQSISKIVSLIIAILDNGMKGVFSKIGVEPTADSFNSIINLETKNLHKPLNPMINSGAIATVSLIKGNSSEEVFNRILDFTKKISGNENININKQVYMSERATGDRNRSLAYFMKSTGVIVNDIEKVLDVYFKQCSIEVTCRDISRIGAFLANDGVIPWTGERIISKETARVVKTIMVTCGMYDASGEFAVNIGIPGKSGVGGGILASVPGKMGIGVIGPSLDEKGNSIAGIKILEKLSKELNLSIF